MKNKKNKILQNDKFKYFKLLLNQKGYTIKDLKCEVSLMICHMLIENYLTAEKEGNSSMVMEEFQDSDKKLIFVMMQELQNSIYNNILTIEKIKIISMNKNKSQKNLIQYKLTEPLSHFYNLGINSLKSKILEQNEKGINILWIPELIAITLINDLENEGYSYKKFTFIDEFDFDRLFRVYNNTNILLKRKEGKQLISLENQTIINKMQNVSNHIAASIISSKYK